MILNCTNRHIGGICIDIILIAVGDMFLLRVQLNLFRILLLTQVITT